MSAEPDSLAAIRTALENLTMKMVFEAAGGQGQSEDAAATADKTPSSRNIEEGQDHDMEMEAAELALLEDIIESMDLARIRALFRSVVRTVPEARLLAVDHLVTQQNHHYASSAGGGAAAADIADAKRKEAVPDPRVITARYMRCKNCDLEFDATRLDTLVCVWHEGEKELDQEAEIWDDHWESSDGDYGLFIDDEEYQAGFRWDCCQKAGNAPGCMKTRHEPTEGTNKRIRLK